VNPAREDDVVDDLRACRDERLYGFVVLEPLAEPLACGFECLAKRFDGRDVAAQRSLERCPIDERRRGGQLLVRGRHVSCRRSGSSSTPRSPCR